MESLIISVTIYLLLMLMGFTLGFMGSGGGLLSFPILVYVAHYSPLEASVLSLAIIGVCALVGAFASKNALSPLKTIFPFILMTLITLTLMRRFVLPYLVDVFGKGVIDQSIMMGLVIVISISSYLMFKGTNLSSPKSSFENHLKLLALILGGAGLGMLIGFLGVGGGFLIVPILVSALDFTMEKATSTSLMIVGVNSSFGYLVDPHSFSYEQYYFLFGCAFFASIGVLLGRKIINLASAVLPQQSLKKGFAVFMLFMAILILDRQIGLLKAIINL